MTSEEYINALEMEIRYHKDCLNTKLIEFAKLNIAVELELNVIKQIVTEDTGSDRVFMGRCHALEVHKVSDVTL